MVTIVVFLGLIHGLVVLPIVYAAIPFHKSKKKNNLENSLSSIGPIKIAIDNSPDSIRRFKLSHFSNVKMSEQNLEKEENNDSEVLRSVTRG